MTEVLSATGLAKAYKGRRVVNGMSMSVHAGEIVGLLGPNGAGKTTCFYLMVGLATSDEGAITLSGEDVTHLPIHLRARGVLATFLRRHPSSEGCQLKTISWRFWIYAMICLRRHNKPSAMSY